MSAKLEIIGIKSRLQTSHLLSVGGSGGGGGGGRGVSGGGYMLNADNIKRGLLSSFAEGTWRSDSTNEGFKSTLERKHLFNINVYRPLYPVQWQWNAEGYQDKKTEARYCNKLQVQGPYYQ